MQVFKKSVVVLLKTVPLILLLTLLTPLSSLLAAEEASKVVTPQTYNSQVEGSVSPLLQNDKASQEGKTILRPGEESNKILEMIVSLVSVILLIMLIAIFFKKAGGGRMLGSHLIKVKTVHPVGQKERLAVVEVYGKTLLVGVATGSVNLIAEFKQEELASFEADQQPEPQGPQGLAEFLKKLPGFRNKLTDNPQSSEDQEKFNQLLRDELKRKDARKHDQT